MNKEIELILMKLKIVSEEKENGAYICDKEHSKLLLSYIEQLRKKIDQYENPEDLTLFYMWLDTNAKDKMKQLQQENQQLKKQKHDAIKYIKSKKAIINTDYIRIFDLFEIDEQGYTEELLRMLGEIE